MPLNKNDMNKILIILICLLNLQAFGQNEWESWDKNYTEVSLTDICNAEKQYAERVEQDKNIPQYYARIDKYKIKAKYLGEFKKLDAQVLNSMKNVFTLYIGNPDQLNEMVKNKCLFEIEGYRIWLPVQKVLEKSLKKELKNGDNVILYCLFMNEHSHDGHLSNIFFVSEFR